jgi:hypothetical protein
MSKPSGEFTPMVRAGSLRSRFWGGLVGRVDHHPEPREQSKGRKEESERREETGRIGLVHPATVRRFS